jgi:hypothetical protein
LAAARFEKEAVALAVVVYGEQRAVLREVVMLPLLLGTEEPLDVGG